MTARCCWLLPLALVWLVACDGGSLADSQAEEHRAAEPDWSQLLAGSGDYLGAAACAHCHAVEHGDWQGSHHALAMQKASVASVLGDFDQARFEYAGISSQFFMREGSYRVLTDGPDGELAEFEIAYTFGVEPLQQYLIELPGGRLQAFGIAWDSRPEAEGGQRWFHLYPDQAIRAGDPLHWTGRNQNWNHMCADCHSTAVVKGYAPDSDTFDTRYAEINVACEACHGPGRAHIEWALDGALPEHDPGLAVRFDERRGITWLPDPDTGTARRSALRRSQIEIDSCGRCHGRASRLLGDTIHSGSLLDSHRPVLLDPDQFHPDGQMLAEVFNWASFQQSRMAQAGVSCADCHQPHSLQLRAPGNAVCAQCHQPDRFDQPSHTGHRPDSSGSQCSACHMPQVTFMEIDRRHDHAFRIPRPDLSLAYGVPNACTDCHGDQSAEWARDVLAEWFPAGPDRSRDFVHALTGARLGAPGASEALERLVADVAQPAVVRASAVRALTPWLDPARLATLVDALADADPLVRMSAVEALAGIAPALRRQYLAPLLADPVRAVRIEAAEALAGLPEQGLSREQGEHFERALAEYRMSIDANADRPEAMVRLGNLEARRGRPEAAVAAYRRALALEPATVEAWINLADLEHARSGEDQVDAILRQGLARVPGSADLHHALGLSLVRQQRLDEALRALARAAELAPDKPDYGHVLAVALHQSGQVGPARRWLEQTLERHPHHRDSLATLAILQAQAGNRAEVRVLVKRLAALDPASVTVSQLRRWLGD